MPGELHDIMKKKNYVALKKATEARNDRKRLVAKFILRKVKELGRHSSIVVVSERKSVLPSPWTDFARNLEKN